VRGGGSDEQLATPTLPSYRPFDLSTLTLTPTPNPTPSPSPSPSPSPNPNPNQVRGDETDEQLATLCARGAEVDMILIEAPEGVSRLHGSRRLFNTLKVGSSRQQ
jgi:hypothetical protein